MAVEVVALRLPTSAPSGWEFLDAATKQRLKLLPANSLKLYFPCDELYSPARDALYGIETLTPSWGAMMGLAGEAGFGKRLDLTVNLIYHSFIANFTTVFLAICNAAAGWTIDQRVNFQAVTGTGWLWCFGSYSVGEIVSLFRNGTNLQLRLSKNGTAVTSYSCSGLTLSAGVDYHIRASYKYIADGASEVAISVDGVNYLLATNAIGPLYASATAVPTLGARAQAGAPYASDYGCIGLYDELLFYPAQRAATYTPPTAPHLPYPVDQPPVSYRAASMDGPSAWDMSAILLDGENLDYMDFRYRTDAGAWSGWLTQAALLAETDPAHKTTFELDARPIAGYTGAVATCPILCGASIEATLDTPLPPVQVDLQVDDCSVVVGTEQSVTVLAEGGTGEGYLALVDWGDDSEAEEAELGVPLPHIYAAAENYTVSVIVTDSEENVGGDSLKVAVLTELIIPQVQPTLDSVVEV